MINILIDSAREDKTESDVFGPKKNEKKVVLMTYKNHTKILRIEIVSVSSIHFIIAFALPSKSDSIINSPITKVSGNIPNSSLFSNSNCPNYLFVISFVISTIF